MDFGLFLEFPRTDGGTEQDAFQKAFRLVDMAEQMGVDSVWLADYHFSEGRVLASPITVASAIPARTQRVPIGLAALPFPLGPPVRFPGDIANPAHSPQ